MLLSDRGLALGGGLAWLRDGRLIYISYAGRDVTQFEEGIWQIKVDVGAGQPSGRATRIASWPGTYSGTPGVSNDGKHLAFVKMHAWTDIYVGELKDKGTRLGPPKRFTSSESWNTPDAWTRDSSTILFISNRTGSFQIFKQRLGTDTAEPFLKGQDNQFGALLSPDATWILYWSTARGPSSPTTSWLMRVPATGGPPEQVVELPVDRTIDFRCPLRPPGTCIISRGEQEELVFYFLDPLRGQGKEAIRTKLGKAGDAQWSLSPDGSRIVVVSRAQIPEKMRILDLKNGTEHDVQLPSGWIVEDPTWTADGNSIFAVINSSRMYIANIGLDGKTSVVLDGIHSWAWSLRPSPDGKQLAYWQRVDQSNVWLLENF